MLGHKQKEDGRQDAGSLEESLGPRNSRLFCTSTPFCLLHVASPALREILGLGQRGKNGPLGWCLASQIHCCCCRLE